MLPGAQRMVVGHTLTLTLTLLGLCAEDERRCNRGALAEALVILPGAAWWLGIP